MTSLSGPWREPAEESKGLYPNLVVADNRQTGSITLGASRLPIWAIIYTAIHSDWEEVEAGWSPTEHYGFTERDLSDFLYNLLEMRGEFGRLLLVLADAERRERDIEDAMIADAVETDHPAVISADEYGSIIDMTPGREGSFERPDPWWANPELAGPVREQLVRCLEALDEGVDTWREEMTEMEKEERS